MMILNRTSMSPFAQMQRELNDLVNAAFAAVPQFVPPVDAARNIPAMNIWEEQNCYRIEAELPGYSMNDVEVTVHGDEVTIKGERTIDQPQGATYLRRERASGSFSRTWTLPAEIDADQVEATLVNGVLLITLPKTQKALPRRIEVKTIGK